MVIAAVVAAAKFKTIVTHTKTVINIVKSGWSWFKNFIGFSSPPQPTYETIIITETIPITTTTTTTTTIRTTTMEDRDDSSFTTKALNSLSSKDDASSAGSSSMMIIILIVAVAGIAGFILYRKKAQSEKRASSFQRKGSQFTASSPQSSEWSTNDNANRREQTLNMI